jgi:hypothetical protein
MLSPRRSAQLGLGAASLILVASVAVLVAGAADPNKNKDVQQTTGSSVKSTSSDVRTELMPMGVAQTLAVTAKQ